MEFSFSFVTGATIEKVAVDRFDVGNANEEEILDLCNKLGIQGAY